MAWKLPSGVNFSHSVFLLSEAVGWLWVSECPYKTGIQSHLRGEGKWSKEEEKRGGKEGAGWLYRYRWGKESNLLGLHCWGLMKFPPSSALCLEAASGQVCRSVLSGHIQSSLPEL